MTLLLGACKLHSLGVFDIFEFEGFLDFPNPISEFFWVLGPRRR
jgi:hypothetical protein